MGKFIDIDFEIKLKNERIQLNQGDVNLQFVGVFNNYYLYEFSLNKLKVILKLLPEMEGISCSIEIQSELSLHCGSISLILTYQEKNVDLSNRRVPCIGKTVADSGLHVIGEERLTKPDTRYCGLFKNSREPCVFMGTMIPQKNLHLYQAKLIGKDTVQFVCTTLFTKGQKNKHKLKTETTWISISKPPLESLMTYANFTPLLSISNFSFRSP